MDWAEMYLKQHRERFTAKEVATAYLQAGNNRGTSQDPVTSLANTLTKHWSERNLIRYDNYLPYRYHWAGDAPLDAGEITD